MDIATTRYKITKTQKARKKKQPEAALIYVFKFRFLAEQPYEKRFKEAPLSVSADLSSGT